MHISDGTAAAHHVSQHVADAVAEVRPRMRGWLHAATAPVALVAGVLIVTTCYVALNLVYLRLLPLDDVRASTRIAADADYADSFL